MARVQMDGFDEGTELVRVYLATTLDEAGAVERVLDAAGVEYAVEVEAYQTRSLILGTSARNGAGFWVRAEAVAAAAAALERAGHVRGLVDSE